MPRPSASFATLLVCAALGGCARPEVAPVGEPAAQAPAPVQHGVASYYSRSLDGRVTASGERYDEEDFTAAHRTLPLGTRVRVTEPGSGRSVVVRINDRGPFVEGRDIDLSRRAAEELGIVDEGVAPVSMQLVPEPG